MSPHSCDDYEISIRPISILSLLPSSSDCQKLLNELLNRQRDFTVDLPSDIILDVPDWCDKATTFFPDHSIGIGKIQTNKSSSILVIPLTSNAAFKLNQFGFKDKSQ